MRGTQGVDTWQDLTFATGADGKSEIKGSAYFKDVNKLLMNAGEQAGGASAGALTSKLDGATWTVAMGVSDGGAASETASSASKLNEDQLKSAMQQAQAQWEASKSLVAPMIEGAKISTTVKAGGTITSATGFTKSDDQTATLSFGGAKVISAIDTLMSDPKIMADALASGDTMGVLRDQKRLQRAIMESMTEGKGLPEVQLTPGKPVIDYSAEVAKAAASQTESFKSLLAEAQKPKDAVVRPPGGAPKKINPPTTK